MLPFLFGLFILIIVIIFSRRKTRQRTLDPALVRDADNLLSRQISFYRSLDDASRKVFLKRVLHFLETTRITGIGVEVTAADQLMVAASAIIPIHHFPDWEYRNIREVLLYPQTFSKEFSVDGEDRNVLGMVGDGAMNGQMILSQPALREGFRSNDGHNTAIHEFVHLIDKADGSVDGVPEYLLAQPSIIPWIRLMRAEIARMRAGDSDLNPYGATNEAEFFAVIGEYFFEKPKMLRERHPALYQMLEKMYTGKGG